MKKTLSVFLTLAICFSLFTATGLFSTVAEVLTAVDTADTGETGGTTRQGLVYTLLEDGTLEVTGYTGSGTVLTLPYEINGKQVTSVADSAFENNTSINTLQAYGLVKIGKWAFKGCTNLAEVFLNEGVEIIGEGAFETTTSLTKIAFPSTVKEIGVWSFADSAISTIDFNNCNARILRKAFFRCDNLKTVNIPKTVTYLGDNVFAECAKLSGINVEGHGPSCGVAPYGSVTPVFTGTQHPLCAVECTHEGEHGNVTFTPWTDSSTLPAESGCYALLTDVALSETYYPPAELTLCLNGYTVSHSSGGRIMYVPENAVVNICDCRENPGRFLGGTSEHIGAIYAYCATLNIYNGIITGYNLTDRISGDGAALYFFESTVNMYGGEITGNTVAGEGAGVHAVKGTFNMYGGSIHGNTAYSGGAIYVGNGIANIYGGEIYENTATYEGGAVYINGNASLNLAGGVIRDNRSDRYGGGIYAPGAASVEISGIPQIYDNTDTGGTTDLRLSNSVTVSVGVLREGAYLSVSLIQGDSEIITEGGAEYADYFISAFPESVHIVTDRLGNICIGGHSYENVIYPENATDESGTAYYRVCACGKTDGSTFAPHGSHASCGEACTHLGAHGSAEFRIWNSESTLPSTPGSYYLNHTVFLESTWEITSGEYIICLNGRNIDARTLESGSIISVASGAKLTLCNCQIGGGELFGGNGYDGGAVNNCGELSVFKLIIRDNTASNDGGGICNTGTAEIYDSEIKNNSAGQRGGGIYSNTDSVLRLYNVKVTGGTAGNATGGIRSGNYLYMKGGEVSGNTGPFGAGISIYGSAEIDSVTISSNNSRNVSGAIDNNGDLKLLNCRLSENYSPYGGAIYNSGNLQIDNCSFVSNSAERGGAIHQSSEAIIKNSVFESNTASVRGGAIYNSGVMELINSTLSSNSATEGAGIYLQESSEALIAGNSVISGNTASGSNEDIYMNDPLKLTVSNLGVPFVAYVNRNTEASSVKILGGAEYKDYFLSVADSGAYHLAVIGDDLDFNVHFYEYFINEETRYIREDADGEFYCKSCACGRLSDVFFEVSPIKHPVCGLTCNHEEKHENLTFIIWRYYEKLPDASGNFVLDNDVCLTQEMFTVGKNIVLCLNGHTVYRSDNAQSGIMGSMISLWSGSELTICDCQEQCGCISEGVTANGGAIKNYATLNIYNGIFTGNSSAEDGGAIVNEGVMNFYGGEISGNTASEYGGAIINRPVGTLNIYGGVIKENSAQWGGGIANESGTVNIFGGEIQNNSASELGGGIYTYNTGRTSSSGTAVYYGSVNIFGGEISLNTAPRGAGIYAADELNISGGEIRQNSGATYGGGIYIDAESITTVTGGSIIANDSVYGGGIHNEGVINFAGGLISQNTSVYGGAGLRNGEVANITGGIISGNTAGTLGGGVVSERNTLISIAGEPVIMGNSSANGIDNLYLDPGVVITVGTMTANANIGITLGNSEIREFTEGGGEYHSLFSSDSGDCAVNISGDNLMLDHSYNVQKKAGDINNDGDIAATDIIALSQLVASGSYNLNSDVNGDLITNVNDIVLLSQTVAAG